MANSIEQMETNVIKNPTYWERKSALKRGLTIIAVSGALLCIALVIGIAVIASNSSLCNEPNTLAPGTCLTDSCIHAASKVLKNMDKSVEPCDDFYRFSCGQFLKTTMIPDDRSVVNIFSEVNDHLRKQLRIIIEEPSPPNESKPFKLAKNLYKACMNTTVIEKDGVEPLLQILKELGGWPVLKGNTWKEDDFDWRNITLKLSNMGYSVDYFLDVHIGVDSKNTTKRAIILDEASFGPSHGKIQPYFDYMVYIATTLGADSKFAQRELTESLNFELKLYGGTSTEEERRNETFLYNPMTVTELNTNYPFIDWMEYFSKLLPSSVQVGKDEMVIVKVPSYLKYLGKLLADSSKRVQANYVMWRVIKASVTYLNEEVRERQFFYETASSGKIKRESRWKECIDNIADNLPVSVGALYVRKYFNEDAKKNAKEMVHDIRVQFNRILNNANWMDEITRKNALEKAASMSTHIAYPDELLDDKKLEEFYSNIELSENNYLQNVLNLTLFYTGLKFSQLRKPVNKSDWLNHGSPAVVNAFYHPIENSIQFPAGILQGTFFSNDRPRYMNYGAIGFVIGHEITHGFVLRGTQYDKDGNLVDWWAPSTEEKYLKKAECIIDQYGNYTVKEVGLQLNSIQTEEENIADNGGIKEAYWAYRDWSDRNGPEARLPGLDYSPRQMFWISFANTWCASYRQKLLEYLVKSDSHSPSEFRVLGSLSNMKEFAEDFKCPVGSKMNPGKKCGVW